MTEPDITEELRLLIEWLDADDMPTDHRTAIVGEALAEIERLRARVADITPLEAP